MSAPSPNLITLTADQARKNNAELKDLRDTIRRHVYEIQHQIKDSIENKRSTLSYGIETNFDVKYMKLKDARDFVYAGIIEELVLARYGVKLRPTANGQMFMDITWSTQQDEEERRWRSELIAQALRPTGIRPREQVARRPGELHSYAK